MLNNIVLLLSVLIIANTANRVLLVGGGGRSSSGGSSSSKSRSSSGATGSSGGGSIYEFNIYINLTYEWIPVMDNESLSLLYNYSAIWTDIEPLINDSENVYKIHQFHDKTRDKSDIIYNETKQLIYEERNQTLFKQLKFQIETEYKTKLTNYLKGSDFERKLLSKLSKSIEYHLQFNAIYVKTERITIDPAIVYTIIGVSVGIFLFIGVVFCWKTNQIYYLKRSCCINNNEVFENKNKGTKHHEDGTHFFIDGLYNGHYYQYQKRHPIPDFKLIFDENNKVTGSGTDTVGDYNIEGSYSANPARMQLNQIYIADTGDREQNLGHSVKIKLQWSNTKQQFEGKWHVKTRKYEGTGKWVIKRSGDLKQAKRKEKVEKQEVLSFKYDVYMGDMR